MLKTLTEQWREGTLPCGAYYVNRLNEICIYLVTYQNEKNTHEIYEVLAPVPSYDEIKRLQEQLKEANEAIKFYAETTVGHKQKDGTYGMWVCSGEVAWENPLYRIESKMDYICYDPRPAKKYLKKWGVK